MFACPSPYLKEGKFPFVVELRISVLHSSASDLGTPTSELIRLVRLYSAQWEEKSNIFKKIHDDYERQVVNFSMVKILLPDD